MRFCLTRLPAVVRAVAEDLDILAVKIVQERLERIHAVEFGAGLPGDRAVIDARHPREAAIFPGHRSSCLVNCLPRPATQWLQRLSRGRIRLERQISL